MSKDDEFYEDRAILFEIAQFIKGESDDT